MKTSTPLWLAPRADELDQVEEEIDRLELTRDLLAHNLDHRQESRYAVSDR